MTTQKRKPSNDPVQIDSKTWFYENAKSLTMVREVRDRNGEYVQTEQFLIPWRKLKKTVEQVFQDSPGEKP